MTSKQFKSELLADLAYQLEHKGKPFTSEHWYFSGDLYPLDPEQKIQVISLLIADGFIRRASSVEFFPDRNPFDILVLCRAPVALRS